MKTPEDEAFDELARKQGAWGGGFPAKRKMTMDKIHAEFYEKYVRYRTAFPKEYTAPQPAQESVAKYSDIVSDGGLDPRNKMDAQPAQEPHEYDWSMLEAAKESLREHMARIKELEAALKQALEALEESIDTVRHNYEADWRHGYPTRKAQLNSMKQGVEDHEHAITAIKAALAQPESEIKSWGETHPRNPSAACSCEHWQSCVECRPTAHAQPAQEPFGHWHWEQPMTKPLQGWFVKGPSNGKLNGVSGIALYTAPQEQWNAALDEVAARIGEIKGFKQATQDSFAVFIQSLKK